MKMLAFGLATTLLLSCRDQAPPAPTAEESAELNEMEDSLNSQARNEEGPEANASDPSNHTN